MCTKRVGGCKGATSHELLRIVPWFKHLPVPDVSQLTSAFDVEPTKMQVRLADLEKGLLEALATAEGDLLEDTSLIERLSETKATAAEIQVCEENPGSSGGLPIFFSCLLVQHAIRAGQNQYILGGFGSHAGQIASSRLEKTGSGREECIALLAYFVLWCLVRFCCIRYHWKSPRRHRRSWTGSEMFIGTSLGRAQRCSSSWKPCRYVIRAMFSIPKRPTSNVTHCRANSECINKKSTQQAPYTRKTTIHSLRRMTTSNSWCGRR